MAKFVAALCLAALLPATALELKGSERVPADVSLKQWLNTGECFNLAVVPQYNDQHNVWGVLEHLRSQGDLRFLTGISATSGSTVAAAGLAAGRTFEDFNKVFPQEGWTGFGPSEPKITDDYMKFLSSYVPKTFEELKVPLAISVTAWDNEESLKNFSKTHAQEMILAKGELYPAMITSIATGNNGVIPDSSCPKCAWGLWPREVEGKYPVTDGAFKDIWGTHGLVQLPKCHRLLHVLPMDFVGQTEVKPASEIPGEPTEVVTVKLTQPTAASQSYFIERQVKALGYSFSMKKSQDWNKQVFKKTSEGIKNAEGKAMHIEKVVQGKSKHYSVTLDTATEMRKTMDFKEKAYDSFVDNMRDNFWKFWKDHNKKQ